MNEYNPLAKTKLKYYIERQNSLTQLLLNKNGSLLTSVVLYPSQILENPSPDLPAAVV